MLTLINDAILRITDSLLGWLLLLPTDLALILVAVGTGAILTFARVFTTNQDLLRRCSQDKKRLRKLIRVARLRSDKAAVGRHRATRNMIALKTMKAEGLPLLAAIVPIAVLAVWCFQRLAFVRPRAGDTVRLIAYFAVSAAEAGYPVHIVPQDEQGLHAEDGWVQQIVAVSDSPAEPPAGVPTPYAAATWHLTAAARPDPYVLEIRYRRDTCQTQLLVGQPTYAPPVEFYGDNEPIVCTEVQLEPVRLFGLVPGIEFLGLPPWLVAYFLIAIPSMSLLKRLTGIY